MPKKGGLGRGLDAIFAENTAEQDNTITLKINEIEPNREQPRKDFDDAALNELADSIAQHGVISPIMVRPIFSGGYQIVTGERRWRAARMAGLTEIPVIIREMDDREFMELALIENLQREDLSPLEEAEGYSSLMESYGLTQEEVSKTVGKSRPVIANALRLLKLPENVRKMIENGELSSGHGRTLLGLNDESKIETVAEKAVKEELSVRALEKLVKKINEKVNTDDEDKPKAKNHYYEEVRLALGESLQRKVSVTGTKKKGTLTIEFYGEDDLNDLLAQIRKGF